jgi:hypothetical protein
MEYQYFLDPLPLWSIFALSAALIALALELGYRLGALRRKCSPLEKDTPVSAVVGATLGLSGFMLAMTFGIAVSRFDFRREVLLDEVDAISTTYLYADFLPPDLRDDVKANLREYVDVRIAGINLGKLESALAVSQKLHQSLWSLAVAAERTSGNAVSVALFIQSLDAVLNVHTRRVEAGLGSRIPAVVWVVLYGVAALGMGEIGYQMALAGSARSIAGIGLVLSFAAVLWLVADLDRPHGGLLRVSQRAMQELRSSMSLAPPP